jgi:hypothetical protein
VTVHVESGTTAINPSDLLDVVDELLGRIEAVNDTASTHALDQARGFRSFRWENLQVAGPASRHRVLDRDLDR